MKNLLKILHCFYKMVHLGANNNYVSEQNVETLVMRNVPQKFWWLSGHELPNFV